MMITVWSLVSREGTNVGIARRFVDSLFELEIPWSSALQQLV